MSLLAGPGVLVNTFCLGAALKVGPLKPLLFSSIDENKAIGCHLSSYSISRIDPYDPVLSRHALAADLGSYIF